MTSNHITSMADAQPPKPSEITGSRVASSIRINVALIVLTTIVIALRAYARIYINRYFGSDDYIICLAVLTSVGLSVLVIVGTKYGLGLHTQEITDFASMQVSFLKVIFTATHVYTLAMVFTKVSILLFYLRLQPREAASPGFRTSVYALMFFVISVSVMTIFGLIFQCSPIAFAWDMSLNGVCINRVVFYHFTAGFNVVGDLAVYFLAIPLVQAANLPRRQKRGLYIVLCMGCFVCVSSIIRMVFLHKVSYTLDPTWALVDPFNWSTIEANIGILCACIPSFKTIVNRYAPKLLGTPPTAPRKSKGIGNIISLSLKEDNLELSQDYPNSQADIDMGNYGNTPEPEQPAEESIQGARSMYDEGQYGNSQEQIIKGEPV